MPSLGHKVIVSFESSDGSHCVDIFVRPDHSFGFEEFRSESDGAQRWQSMGKHASLVFHSGEAALLVAQERVAWLSKSESWRW
jgi:hypothetical protein